MDYWTIEFKQTARKQFKLLDKTIQKQIEKYLLKLIASAHPRQHGQKLKPNLSHLWRYRVGDYRLLCEIQDNVLTVFVVEVVHRSKAYK